MADMNELDLVFSALADSTRRGILARLAEGEATVSELSEPFELTQPAISKHLKVLQDAKLISVQIDGQKRPRKLEPVLLDQAMAWIERYKQVWEASYARLDGVLAQLKIETEKMKPKKDQPTKSQSKKNNKLSRRIHYVTTFF